MFGFQFPIHEATGCPAILSIAAASAGRVARHWLAVSSALVPWLTAKYASRNGFSPLTRADVIDARFCPAAPDAGSVRGAGGATQARAPAASRRALSANFTVDVDRVAAPLPRTAFRAALRGDGHLA